MPALILDKLKQWRTITNSVFQFSTTNIFYNQLTSPVTGKSKADLLERMDQLISGWKRLWGKIEKGSLQYQALHLLEQGRVLIHVAEGHYPAGDIDKVIHREFRELRNRIFEQKPPETMKETLIDNERLYKQFREKWNALCQDFDALFELYLQGRPYDRFGPNLKLPELHKRFSEIKELWPEAVNCRTAGGAGNLIYEKLIDLAEYSNPARRNTFRKESFLRKIDQVNTLLKTQF